MSERGGFFWFDPFGGAPADAEVSGRAGGPIFWGGIPSWPFEHRKDHYPFSFLRPYRPRSRHEPHFQLFTDRDPDAPPPQVEPRFTITRQYVMVDLAGEEP